ncbi:hypothetical protein HF324_28505 [Chitinophaga oryzae]|uniref:Colicin immunity protein / pyocin immunity protein n=1 Tax=Chitinophaga oryzae TaxID=2725414 RepID=A0AAE7DA42_9BACT|nr:hypothetical protein [Chitinophaga oryzae]QJB35058.1 hypothetical protein HF329_28630 [Chitinophaga oryzae]QJB41575.1 hypothetical protein HF324_28505 [Chitinophaga oryzae]
MTRSELINIAGKIVDAQGSEAEQDRLLDLLIQNVPDPNIANYIFYDDLTPEEIVDKALAYKPIQL